MIELFPARKLATKLARFGGARAPQPPSPHTVMWTRELSSMARVSSSSSSASSSCVASSCAQVVCPSSPSYRVFRFKTQEINYDQTLMRVTRPLAGRATTVYFRQQVTNEKIRTTRMRNTSVGQPGRVLRKTVKEMSGDPLVWTRGPGGMTMNRRCAPAQTLKLTTQLSRLVAILIHAPTRAIREDQRTLQNLVGGSEWIKRLALKSVM